MERQVMKQVKQNHQEGEIKIPFMKSLHSMPYPAVSSLIIQKSDKIKISCVCVCLSWSSEKKESADHGKERQGLLEKKQAAICK